METYIEYYIRDFLLQLRIRLDNYLVNRYLVKADSTSAYCDICISCPEWSDQFVHPETVESVITPTKFNQQ